MRARIAAALDVLVAAGCGGACAYRLRQSALPEVVGGHRPTAFPGLGHRARSGGSCRRSDGRGD